MEFCKAYNAQTESQRGSVIPVEITVYEDRSFTFVTKTPPAAELIKKGRRRQGLRRAAQDQGRQAHRGPGPGDRADKLEDLTPGPRAASKIIAGTARSMGITVEG
jgi:large subunit ribosomal protein L11